MQHLAKESEGVNTCEEDECDVRGLIDEATPDVVTKYGKYFPQYVLWEELKKHNSLRKKQQMHWHPLVAASHFLFFLLFKSHLSNH